MTNQELKNITNGLITDFKTTSDTMVDFCNSINKLIDEKETLFTNQEIKFLIDAVYFYIDHHADINGTSEEYLNLIEKLREIQKVTMCNAVREEVRNSMNRALNKNGVIDNAPTVNTIIISKNATNGDIIKTLFPTIDKYNNILLENHSKNILFDNEWWNTPYRKED